MSIYTYFPSRDALLEAVAEHIFALFESPPAMDRWQDFTLEWLRAITRHFERCPVALQVSRGANIYPYHGCERGCRYARAAKTGARPQKSGSDFRLFLTATIGFINAHHNGPKRMVTLSEDVLLRLESEDRRPLEDMRQHQGGPNEKRRLEYAFRNIIAGLETSLAENRLLAG